MLTEQQKAIEHKYSRKNINAKIRQCIEENNFIMDLIRQAVSDIEDYAQKKHYQSKQDRWDALVADRDIHELVMKMCMIILPSRAPQQLVSVVGEVTAGLKLTEEHQGAKTAGELIALLAMTGLFDLGRRDDDSWQIETIYPLDEKLYLFVQETKYLPPMICAPNKVTKNFDSVYLTQSESMILGKGNHHNNDICLDSLNVFNSVALTLNTDILTTFSETPPDEWSNADHQAQWHKFVMDSYTTYKELVQAGNEFHIVHKYDKRGRTYAQGYHVSTQGNKFRKAIIEFKHKELATS